MCMPHQSVLFAEAALPLIEAWLYTSSLDLSIDSNSFTPPRPPAHTNGVGQRKRSVSPPPKPGEGRRKRSKSPPPPPSQAAPSLNGTEAPPDVRVRVAGVRDPFDRAVMEAPASTPEVCFNLPSSLSKPTVFVGDFRRSDARPPSQSPWP